MGSMIEPHASWVRGLARAVGVNPSAIQVKARLRGLFPTNLHPRRSVASVPIRVLFQCLGPVRAGLEHGDATPKRRPTPHATSTPPGGTGSIPTAPWRAPPWIAPSPALVSRKKTLHAAERDNAARAAVRTRRGARPADAFVVVDECGGAQRRCAPDARPGMRAHCAPRTHVVQSCCPSLSAVRTP